MYIYYQVKRVDSSTTYVSLCNFIYFSPH